MPRLDLTLRQRQCLALIADGCTDRQIATRMGVEVTTVRTHVEDIFNKLCTRSRANAVSIGYRKGILK